MAITSATSPDPTAVVGLNLRAEMVRKARTQTGLASCLGISQVAVSKRLTGRTPLDVNELVRAAQWLGVPLARLLDGVESSAVPA